MCLREKHRLQEQQVYLWEKHRFQEVPVSLREKYRHLQKQHRPEK